MKTDHILQGGLHLRRRGPRPVPGGLHPMSAGAADEIQKRQAHRIRSAIHQFFLSRKLRRRAARRLRALRLANGQTLYYQPK